MDLFWLFSTSADSKTQNEETVDSQNNRAIVSSQKNDTERILDFNDEESFERNLYAHHRDLLGDYTMFRDQGLTIPLTRAFKIVDVLWNGAAPINTVLTTITFPDALLAQPFINDKLKNFNFLKTDIEVSMRINAPRQTYGALIASWLPYNDDPAVLTSNFINASTYPHLLLSPSSGDTQVLRIPFIYGNPGYNLINRTPPIGKFYLIVAAPLRTVDATVPANITFTVFANFVNTKVWGMTSNSLTSPLSIVYQSGEARGKSSSGLLSGIAQTVSDFAKPLSSIPIIGGIIGKIGGTAGFIGNALSIWGLTKPTSLEIVHHNYIKPITSMAHGRGLDGCDKLSLDPENCVVVDGNLGGNMENEMALSYMFSMPSICEFGTWSTTSTADTQILAFPVSPYHMRQGGGGPTFAGSTTASANYSPSILAAASLPYGVWRGSIRYRIYFFASMFHSGRIKITFVPYGAPPSYDCLAKIFDINGETVLDFIVPFQSEFLWCGTSTGTLYFQVVNELVCPDVVSNPAVDYLIYTSGGPDFEVAYPVPRFLVGYDQTTLAPEPVVLEYNPRAEFLSEMTEPLVDGCKYVTHNRITMGESYGTIKDLLMRYVSANRIGSTISDSYTQYLGTVEKVLTVSPSFDGLVPASALTHYSNMFSFWRGSMRFKIDFSSAPPRTSLYRVQAFMGSTLPLPPATFSVLGGYTKSTSAFGSTLIYSAINPVAEIEVPYYLPQVLQSTRNNLGNNNFIIWDELLANINVYRSVGDDFQFHFLHGPGTSYLVNYFPASGQTAVANTNTSFWLSPSQPTPYF